MRYVLNSPVMTNFGVFRYRQIQENEACDWLNAGDWDSAISHESTAVFMSERLGIQIPFNRQPIRMLPGDEALVLRALQRIPNGTRFSTFEIGHLACEFALISMLS